MKKLYASLLAVAFGAFAMSAAPIAKQYKSLETAKTFSLEQVTNLNSVKKAPASRVDIPDEFEGNYADYSIAYYGSYNFDFGGFDAVTGDVTIESVGSNVTIYGLGGWAFTMTGTTSPDGTMTFISGQDVYKKGTTTVKLQAMAVNNNQLGLAADGTEITFSYDPDTDTFESQDYFGFYVPNGGFYGIYVDVEFLKPNGTFSFDYHREATSSSPAADGTMEIPVHVFFEKGENYDTFSVTNITFLGEGCLTTYFTNGQIFEAVAPAVLENYVVSFSEDQELNLRDMILCSYDAENYTYSFPFMGTVADGTYTFPDFAFASPTTTYNLFGDLYVYTPTSAGTLTFTVDQSGVKDEIAPEKAPIRYYNLQGMELSAPEKGAVNIVKVGNKATKMVF